MRTHIQARLEELNKEFESGQARLSELDNQQTLLRETLLRINCCSSCGCFAANPDLQAKQV